MKIHLLVRMTFVLTILVLFGTLKVMGATRYSVADGNWNSTSTWSATSGGSIGASVPITGDDVYLEAGYSVMVTADAACASITFSGSGTTLTVNSAIVLTVSGAVIVISSINTSYSSIITGSGTLNCSSLAVGTDVRPSQDITTILTSSIAAFSISGNLSLYSNDKGNKQNNAIFYLSTGTISVNGSTSSLEDTRQNSTTLSMATGSQNATLILGGVTPFSLGNGTNSIILSGTATTVIYDYSGDQTVYPVAYQNLTLAGSGTKTTTGVTVNDILSMEGTATVSTAPTYGSAATLQYNTATARTVGAEWISPFSATGGVTIANAGSITLNSAKIFNTSVPLTVNSGSTLSMSAFLLTLNGDLINNGGTVNGTTGGVTIAGTATQNIGAFTTTGTVTMTKTGGTATLRGNVNGGGLTINGSGGTIDLGITLTHTFSGDVTLTAGTLNGGSSILNENATSATAWNGTGTVFIAGTGTVNFGGDAQTLSASATTFNNLTFSNSGTKTLSSATIANGALTINSGVTLASANNALTFGGDFSKSGIFTAGSSNITISATGTQNIASFTTTGTVSITKTGGIATFQGIVTAGALIVANTGGTLSCEGYITRKGMS